MDFSKALIRTSKARLHTLILVSHQQSNNSPDQNAKFPPYHKIGFEIGKMIFKFEAEIAYLKNGYLLLNTDSHSQEKNEILRQDQK